MLNKASIKARCRKAYKSFAKQYGEDRECAVYSPRRYKFVALRAYGRIAIVFVGYLGSEYVTADWGYLLMLPVLWIALLGSVSVMQQGMAFKMGWFAGNTDLAITIKKNDPDIPGAVEEQTLRMNFVLEGLGVGRREELWDNEDEE